jgi:cyclopropane-fatty-acyl-phospholipid synthase
MEKAATDLFAGPSRTFAVRLWNGALLPGGPGGPAGCVALKHPSALAAFLPPVNERRLAEAFLDGQVELEGDAIGLLEAASRWEGPRLRPAVVAALAAVVLHRLAPSDGDGRFSGWTTWLRRHAPSRDRSAVRYHYDLSDDFYALFLDPQLVYSCAWFPAPGTSLEAAQRAKLELVCRKLALAPGERLLDVGCGWGALLAHAARHHHASGLGITLSDNQLAEARRRLGRVAQGAMAVEPVDYRALRPGRPFDKVASIGMMEHVGRERLGGYFAAMARVLRPGGLFLNHAIADSSIGTKTLPWAGRRGGGFIERYIFPDSDLVPIGRVVAEAERAGFEVRDLESLREHYAETLAAWLGRLESRFGEAERLVGRRRARAYRLYLATSAVAFRLGRISVFQLLLVKRAADGRAVGVPRDRSVWYAGAGSHGRPREREHPQRAQAPNRGAVTPEPWLTSSS